MLEAVLLAILFMGFGWGVYLMIFANRESRIPEGSQRVTEVKREGDVSLYKAQFYSNKDWYDYTGDTDPFSSLLFDSFEAAKAYCAVMKVREQLYPTTYLRPISDQQITDTAKQLAKLFVTDR